jgi:hypothetical protein
VGSGQDGVKSGGLVFLGVNRQAGSISPPLRRGYLDYPVDLSCSRLFDQRYFAAELEPKASAARLCDVDLRASLFQAAPQQDKPAFEVVFEVGEVERLVETKPAICKLDRSSGLMFVQKLPQNFSRQTSHQVLAIDKNALFAFVILHFDPRSSTRPRGFTGRARAHRQAFFRFLSLFPKESVLDCDCQVASQNFDVGAVFLVEAVRLVCAALDRESEDEVNPSIPNGTCS